MSTKPRKTVSVDFVVKKANQFLAAEGSTPEGRVATALFVESVLFETGNYKGFNYLRSEFLGDGSGLRPGFDDTRRRYYNAQA